jgi:hypothetical protein
MRDGDLTWAIEAISAHIALIWTVQHWQLAYEASDIPLDVQIANFSSHALVESSVLFPILRRVPEEFRWLIYFKGVIAANTHPRDEMLSAIEAIRKREELTARFKATEVLSKNDVDPNARSEALAAIANALSNATP